MMVFDEEYLRDITDGNADIEQELLKRFAETIQRCVALVRSQPVEEWKTALHELRGAASAIGALRFAAFCGKAEKSPPATTEEQGEYRTQLSALAEETLAHIRQSLGQ